MASSTHVSSSTPKSNAHSTPTPTPTPTPHPGHEPLLDPAAGTPPAVIGGHVAKPGEPAPHAAEPPSETVADEQRKRSAEIEAAGVEKWKEDHDDRVGKGAQHQIQGAGHPAPMVEHRHPDDDDDDESSKSKRKP